MQVTLNKISFDVRPVEGALRAALLADPGIARGVVREVWAWDKGEGTGRFLVPVSPDKVLALSPGFGVFVPRHGANGGGPQKADGPTAKMAERLLGAIGAKNFASVAQALARVTGLPGRKVPFEAFAPLNALGSYRVRLLTDYAVVELSHPARNLSAYAFVPSLVAFLHVWEGDAPAHAPAAGSIRPGFLLPPPNEAALTMRRMAVAQRLRELQAALGETRPADLPSADPRRSLAAQLGAEWRVLSPKAKAA